MAKIPFTLEAWLKDKSQKIETRDGRIVHNIWPVKNKTTIKAHQTEVCALIDGEEDALVFFAGGKYLPVNTENPFDLFIVTPEEELTEFEKAIKEMMRGYVKMPDEVIKETAARLLDLATKEIGHKWVIRQESYQDGYINGLHDGKAEALKDLEESGRVHCKSYDIGYDDGKKETLKNLPRWSLSTGCFDKGWVDNGILYYKFHAIPLNTLEKLPEFKEN